MAHTPGPWRVEGEFDAEVSVEIRSVTDVTICEVEPFIENWELEDIANARLIAAAPELLEALKGAVALMTELVDELVAKEQARAQWAETAARKLNENAILRSALIPLRNAARNFLIVHDGQWWPAANPTDDEVNALAGAIATASAALTASTERAESDPPTTKEKS